MKMKETYNIHKKINCIFPFFKSKMLCGKGTHNYRVENKRFRIPNTIITREKVINTIILKCYCCGKEERLDE